MNIFTEAANELIRSSRRRCDGCDNVRETQEYIITYHDRKTDRVDYCDDCAALAEMDWSGEIRNIRPA